MRPLSPAEILDAAWLAVRRQWVACYALSTLGTVPLVLGTVLYFVWLGRLVEGTPAEVFYQGTLWWAAGMAAAWGLNGVARGAVTLLAAAQARGQALEAGAAWRAARRHWIACAGVGLLAFALGWLGSLALVPGVLLAGAWWAARPAALLEERRLGPALRRSRDLTGGHRRQALGLWLLFALLWLVGAANLHLLVGGVLTWAAGLLGVDTTGLRPYLRLENQAYVLTLLGLVFVLLDPVKSAADAFLYLDLGIRREGADLRERLRRWGGAAGVALLLTAGAPARAAGDDVEAYRAAARSLRNRIQAARRPEDVPRDAVRALRGRVVRGPDGARRTADNAWLGNARWSTPEEKHALLDRLHALERSLGPATATAAAPPASLDPKQALGDILAAPEFQPLAERAELREITKRVDLSGPRNWWQAFTEWLQKLFRPDPPEPRPAPSGRPLDFAGLWEVLKWVGIVLLVLLVAVLLALLVRWFLERDPGRAAAGTGAVGAAPLEASATENALEHTVDDWERFARLWLDRGEVRQAIRALYLATLVHLHRERLIEYNRALTNWTYVRRFRGEGEQRSTLEQLTRVFDEVWYGDRPCGEPHYRAFEAGARALGTPAPPAGAAGG